jgi:hypothetical protein
MFRIAAQPGNELFECQWLRKIETLHHLAARLPKEIELELVFDTLRDDPQPQRLAQRENGTG